jgi:hypothetical protein
MKPKLFLECSLIPSVDITLNHMNPELASLTLCRQIHLNVIIDCESVILLESMRFYDRATNIKDNRV